MEVFFFILNFQILWVIFSTLFKTFFFREAPRCALFNLTLPHFPSSIVSRPTSEDFDIDVTVRARRQQRNKFDTVTKKKQNKNKNRELPSEAKLPDNKLFPHSVYWRFNFFHFSPITVIRPLDLCLLHKFKDFIWYPCSRYWISNLGEWINGLAHAENPLKKY